ncbi:MAG: acyl carrier protein [Terriglobales bacterium]|jgi:acyl carrier protein
MEIKSGEIKSEVRKYIADNFLLGAQRATLEDAMPLITGGIIDSIGMIGLVDFLESRFEVEFMPREIDVHSLDTVERIEELIRKKLASRKAGVAAGNGQQIR